MQRETTVNRLGNDGEFFNDGEHSMITDGINSEEYSMEKKTHGPESSLVLFL